MQLQCCLSVSLTPVTAEGGLPPGDTWRATVAYQRGLRGRWLGPFSWAQRTFFDPPSVARAAAAAAESPGLYSM